MAEIKPHKAVSCCVACLIVYAVISVICIAYVIIDLL